jgi:predicted anti-sigma-YlaC factor YlaD
MARTCPEWDRMEAALGIAGVPEAVPSGWQAHLQTCASCRSNWKAREAMLRLTRSFAIPQLQPDFTTRLASRLDAAMEADQDSRRLTLRARRWLAVYWTAAVLASAFILVRIHVPAEVWRFVLFAAAFVLPWLEILPRKQLRRLAALFDSA